MAENVTDGLNEEDWQSLLYRIETQKCTPFLGAGASYPSLPLGGQVARDWAGQHSYPLSNKGDLPHVAQFMAIKRGDMMFPKDEMRRLIGRATSPNFGESDEPHGVLSRLPLNVYLTSNYDGFMHEALACSHVNGRRREPVRDFCRWNGAFAAPVLNNKYEPSVERPLVYHLHGHADKHEAMVLTEDDYLDFLVQVSADRKLIPPRIKEAISSTSLMFIGYRLADPSFRVLFRGLVTRTDDSFRRISVTVQLPEPTGDEAQHAMAIREYLNRYFGHIRMKVYWGSAREFAGELWSRWSAYTKGRLQ